MDLAQKIVWVLGLLSMAYANSGVCIRCSVAPLAIAVILAGQGEKNKAGILILGGFPVPMLIALVAPSMPWWATMTAGLALTAAAYLAIRASKK